MSVMKYLFLIFFISSIVCAKKFNFIRTYENENERAYSESSNTSSISNCAPVSESINEFPPDLFIQEQRIHGAILFHIFVGFYCFVLIAFVCNDYFLPAVFCICQDLHLSPDIAGATFMATATCAPELFVNVIGTFLTESDLGIGTVVGSAVCNILGVTACAGLAASKNIKLEVCPLLRDSGVYIFVVGLLAVVLADGIIVWYEALILVVLYFMYYVLIFAQQRIKSAVHKILSSKNLFKSTSSMNVLTSSISSESCYGTYRSPYFPDFISHFENSSQQNNNKSNTEKKIDDEVEAICSPPGGVLLNLWWLLSFPISALLSISIPDCRVYRKLYPLTFTMCVVWIGISSYIVSWMITIFGYTFGVNDAVMGITFLAIGGSIPEASSAVVNARNGIGSMTISNALGANTLDVLICLGGPWLIKTMLPVHLGGGPIALETASLAFNCVCLIVSVILLNIITFVNSFNMNRLYGSICLLCYFSLITLLILTDMNIIFNFGIRAVCN